MNNELKCSVLSTEMKSSSLKSPLAPLCQIGEHTSVRKSLVLSSDYSSETH